MSASNDNDNVRTFLTVTELCARWGVARRTVTDLIAAGMLQSVRFGQRTRHIPLHAIERIEREGLADARLSG